MLGCRETDVQTGAGGRTAFAWADSGFGPLAAGDALAGRWFEETLEPTRDHVARGRALSPNGAPAAIASTFGKGKTLTLGSFVSAAYQSRPDATTARFFVALLAWAGVTARPVSGRARRRGPHPRAWGRPRRDRLQPRERGAAK